MDLQQGYEIGDADMALCVSVVVAAETRMSSDWNAMAREEQAVRDLDWRTWLNTDFV